MIIVSNLNFNQQDKLTHNKLTPVPRALTPIILLLILLFLSCSTAPSIKTLDQSLESVIPNWERVTDGVGYFQGRLSSPKIDFYALKIDLSSPNISIFVQSEVAPSGGTVSSFVRENNLIAGINANPYDEEYKNIGLVVSDRKVLSPINKNYDALVFYRDIYALRAIIVKQDSIYSTENIENAVGGFYQILEQGEPAQRLLGNYDGQPHPRDARHPRTAAGVSLDGSMLYLVIIDGRRAGSIGATEMETALLLRALGSYDGINLDGGGSSSAAIRSYDGNVKVVNRPSEFGRERKVAAKLGIK